jgi:hypothetical protein
MTNIVYRNLTREEAEQMAFELEVEGKFEFEVKEEGGSWSVHYWSEDQRPGLTETAEGSPQRLRVGRRPQSLRAACRKQPARPRSRRRLRR